jgi:hypothetical protein
MRKKIKIQFQLSCQQVRDQHNHKNCEFVRQSFLEWNERRPEKNYIIALEVLDNLTHDKLVEEEGNLLQVCFAFFWGVCVCFSKCQTQRVSNQSSQKNRNLMLQVEVDVDSLTEVYSPVSDDLILDYLANSNPKHSLPTSPLPGQLVNVFNSLREESRKATKPPKSQTTLDRVLGKFFPKRTTDGVRSIGSHAFSEDAMYIPTSALRMLRTVSSNFPQHSLIVTDFSSLPGAIAGVNGPIVQKRIQGWSQKQAYILDSVQATELCLCVCDPLASLFGYFELVEVHYMLTIVH